MAQSESELVLSSSRNNQTHPQIKEEKFLTPTNVQEEFFLSDLIIQYLEQLEIEFVFGIPGGAIEPFFDALARSENRGGPRIIVSRHETSSAFMADGYQHFSGKLGVCCVTTGPGVTNLITGLASAYANQIPMLVITAQTALPNFGKGALQESSCTGVNTLAMLEPCTRFNTLVSHPDQFEQKLVNAIVSAFGPIPGPSHLSIPFDIWRTRLTQKIPKYYLPNLIPKPHFPNPDQITKVAQQLCDFKNSTFIVGERCGNAIKSILSMAQILQARIVCTPHAKGLVHINHPAYDGVVGFAGHDDALRNLSTSENDCVVTIGATLGEFATSGYSLEQLGNKVLIHIDDSHLNFNLTPMAETQVYGSIEKSCDLLLKEIININPKRTKKSSSTITNILNSRLLREEEVDFYNDPGSPIHPARLMHDLPKLLPHNTRYVADAGNSYAWAIHYLSPADRRVKGIRNRSDALFKTCIEFASMGWAIGYAVGAALALPKQPVACITGDGSFLMSGQEFTVAIQEKLPIIFIILNDSALGMVKHGQRLTGAEQFAYQLPTIDFALYANAMGMKAFEIHSPDDLQQLKAIDFEKLQQPILLDVHINKEAVPPIGKRTEVLKKR